MADQSGGMWNPHTCKRDRITGAEAVNIKALPQPLFAGQAIVPRPQHVLRRCYFKQRLVTGDQSDIHAGSTGNAGVIGEGGKTRLAGSVLISCKQLGEMKGLRCLRPPQTVAGNVTANDRLGAAFHTVNHRQGGNRSRMPFKDGKKPVQYGTINEGPGRIMDQYNFWRGLRQCLQTVHH